MKNKYPTNISRGEAQRVSILRSVINRRRIIIADEPTSNLDDSNANIILELFKQITDSFDVADEKNNSYKIKLIIEEKNKEIIATIIEFFEIYEIESFKSRKADNVLKFLLLIA